MLITSFNRMVRNKWIWMAFSLLVALAFLGYFSPRTGGCGRRAFQADVEAGARGKVFGRLVSHDEFLTARLFEMRFRTDLRLTPRHAAALDRLAWKRIAALETASRMGLTVSPSEITETITRDPSFSVNGVFSKERYRAIILNQLRIDVQTFEEYLRQEILLRKLQNMVESTLLTPPSEMDRRVANLCDEMVAEYTIIEPQTNRSSVAVTEEDAKAFYEKFPKLFEEPEKVAVKYVSFPISNHLESAEVAESEIRDYYDEHDEEFLDETSTNSTNAIASRLPMEKVKDQIEMKLRRQHAAQKAGDAAADFVISILPGRLSPNPPSFEEAAANLGLAVTTTDYFSVRQTVPGVDAGYRFTRAAFEREMGDPARRVSDAIIGSNMVYALELVGRKEKHVPPFDDVKQKAFDLARLAAEHEAFAKLSAEIHADIKQSLATGATFTAACLKHSLPVFTTETFSAYGGITNDNPYAEELAKSAMSLQKGELSDLEAVTNGMLMVYVTDRKPADTDLTLMIRPQLQAMLDRYAGSAAFEEWLEQNLAEAQLVDMTAARQGAAAEEQPSAAEEDEESETQTQKGEE